MTTRMSETMTADDAPDRNILHHVVAFRFENAVTDAQISDLVASARQLKAMIPQVRSLQWGPNNSPENLNKGLTHCFLLTFKREEDRAVYLAHPAHKAFGAKLGPLVADALVIDFWGQD